MSAALPKLDHSERAARDFLNRKVREGLIDRRTANDVMRAGLPLVRTMLAQWRREGVSGQWLTEKFQSKQTEARQRYDAATSDIGRRMATLGVVTAEMYSVVWAGLQADLGQYLAESRKATPEVAD